MTPTRVSGIAKAATGTGTWFALISTSVRVLLLPKVAFKSPGTAACRQNVKYKGRKRNCPYGLAKS